MKAKSIFKKLFFTAAGFLLIVNLNLKAQTITDAYASIADTSGQNNYFTIFLSDSIGIAQVETKIGSQSGDADLLDHVFDFDTAAGSPYSYNRAGNVLKLGIGTITQNGIYYGECRLKYSNGTWSSPYQFINN